jgi:hypothetical protein
MTTFVFPIEAYCAIPCSLLFRIKGLFLNFSGARRMITTASKQLGFYQRFIMARNVIDPRMYGVDMDREGFIDLMCEEFSGHVRGTITIDEMLLRPRSAMHFCDVVRAKHAFHDLPDDMILRVILNRRKNPNE